MIPRRCASGVFNALFTVDVTGAEAIVTGGTDVSSSAAK